MKHFWSSVVQPVLDAARPEVVVEIGAEVGGNTKHLARWTADHGAMLHSIDPAAGSAVAELEREFQGTFVLHRGLSLEALPQIERPDAVLVDGDHNWYTVHRELLLVERICGRWPITVLHDIAAPYGRRDMYYSPDNVPAEWRQTYERDGRGRGIATSQGGPRNGVLTAVEDFMAESSHRLELFAVSGPGGLGLLLERERLEEEPRLAAVVRGVQEARYARHLSPRFASDYFG